MSDQAFPWELQRAARRQAGADMVAWCLELAEQYRSEPERLGADDYLYLKEAFHRLCSEFDGDGTGLRLSIAQRRSYFEIFVHLMNLFGDWSDAMAGLESAVAAGEKRESTSENCRQLAWFYSWLAWFYELSARFSDSERAAHQGLAQARKSGDPASQSEALNRLAKIHRTRGNYRRALAIYRRSIELAERAGDDVALALVLNSTGLTQWHLGELEVALDTLSRALEKTQSANDRRRQAQVLDNLGLVLTALGAYEEARQRLEGALELAESIDDRREIGVVCGNLGEVQLHLGDRERALVFQQRAEREAAGLGSAYRSAKAKIRLSLLWRTTAGPKELVLARDLAREVTEIGDANRLHHFQILGRSYEAMARLALEGCQRAAPVSWEAVRLLERHHLFDGSRAEILFNHYLVLREGDPEPARRALLAADRHLRARAELIRTLPWRQRFLEGIELHRDIRSAADELKPSSD